MRNEHEIHKNSGAREIAGQSCPNWQIILCTCLFLGFFAHGYGLSSGFFAHDSIREMVSISDSFNNQEMKISTGRFVQLAVFAFRGDIAVPWLVGCLAMIYCGFSAFFIQKLFGLGSAVPLCALLICNTAMTLTMNFYVHETDMFALALLFSTLSAYVCGRYPKGYLLSPVFIALACGLYQAYFSMAVLLFMLMIFQEILRGDSPVQVVKSGVKYVSILVIALVFYFIAYKIVLKATGVAVTETNTLMPSASQLLEFFTDGTFFQQLKMVYGLFFGFFLKPVTHNGTVVLLANICLFALFLWVIWDFIRLKRPNVLKIMLMALVLLLLPLGATTACFFVLLAHDLMFAPFVCAYILLFTAMEHMPNGKRNVTVFALIGVIVWQNVIYSNQMYLRQNLAYDNTLSTMTRVLTAMENTEGYVVGETPVLFRNILASSATANQPTYFDHLTGIGMSDHLYSITYYHGNIAYFAHVLGYPVNFSTDYDMTREERFDQMPQFPEIGFCQLVDGVLMVNWYNVET